jgi:hypothetical protein
MNHAARKASAVNASLITDHQENYLAAFFQKM